MIEGLILTPLQIFQDELGSVLHGMKSNENSFLSFGEVYFSTVNRGTIKGWKRHREMTLNIMVPCGEIMFVLFDDRENSATRGEIFSVNLSIKNYQRLTVPPMIWMAFQGIEDGLNMLMNVANVLHDPKESDSLNIKKSHIPYNWK